MNRSCKQDIFLGTSSAILIRATDKSGAEAFLEVKIEAQAIKNNVINCTDYLKVFNL
jgi:phosphoribosyl-dephospho-CoA transferase